MKRRILFVDDEPRELQGLERMLHDRTDAWAMAFATSAAEAMATLLAAPYEVAVLDVRMPDKDGLDLLAEMKANARTSDVEVIMLTGARDCELKRRALDLGAADLLNKPVSKEDLVARLNSALRTRRYRDELRARNALLEQQLLQAQRMEAVGVLAAGVAHDLRNMLTLILGYSEMTERLLAEDARAHKNVSNLRMAGKRARKLVEQIVMFTNSAPACREPCALGPVIGECLELLRPNLPEAVEIVWDGPATERLVSADPTQIHQVVMNLCLNAGQAMKQGGTLTVSLAEGQPDPELRPSDDEQRPGPFVKLEVADTGVGMDEATRQHVFDPLFSTRRTQGGTGLGLCVVQRIVQHHDGVITVESTPGRGTTFTVYFPAIEADAPVTTMEATHGG